MTDPNKTDDFDARLAAAREKQVSKYRPRQSAASMSGAAVGFRIAIEILAAIAVGVGVGLALDIWLGTKPWLLIVFCMLGFGGAMANVMRTARELDRKSREAKQAASKSNLAD
jgi:ATP synthase protein I